MIMLKECKPPKKIQKLQQLHWKQQRKQENQTKEGDEVEEVLNTMGIKKKQAGNDQRPVGMEEDCMGRQGPQRNVMLQQEEKEVLNLAVPPINH